VPDVTHRLRTLVPLAALLALAACDPAAPSPDPVPAPTSAPASATPGGITGTGAAGFTLGAGTEHDVCGIGLVVTFVHSAGTEEAVLLGGPAGKVPGLGQGGADPLPANAAVATAGTVATVVGKRFRVNAVDAAGGRVQLEPLC
jgi:hypothetical protein